MAKGAVQILVAGRVQGVSFRFWTEHRASELGLAGWVRNLSDGRVEIFAEGEEEQLLELFQLCHRGPVAARVTQVLRSPRAPRGLEAFSVERTALAPEDD